MLKINTIVVALLLLVGSFLLIYDLGDNFLWQDEAETACVGRTISLDNLTPKGYDGFNHFSQQRGQEYGDNYVWKLHPWFQFYWISASFALFGESTFTARLPFAILSLATVVFSYFLSLMLWKDRKTAIYTAVFFLISVTFLMLGRQARYYSPAFFFSVYSTFALFSIYQKKNRAYIHYALSTLLLFHSQYLFAIVFWVASLIYTYYFYRIYFKKLCLWIGLLSIPCFIFLIWLLDTPYGAGFSLGIGFAEGLKTYPPFIFNYLFSPLWLAIPIGYLIFSKKTIHWKEEEKPLLFFALIIIGNLLGLLFLGRLVFVRYLCGIIPFLFFFKGRITTWLGKIHLAIPIVVILVTIGFGDLSKYWKELHEENIGPLEAVVGFLEKKSTSQDKIIIGYGDLPLKFYLPNKIYGGLSVEIPENFDSIDFIVYRQNAITNKDLEVNRVIESYLDLNMHQFDAFRIQAPDLRFECRETPDEHYKNLRLKAPNVLVFLRKK